MADMVFSSFKRDVANGSIDLDTDTIKVLLVTSTYTPSAAHDKRDDITNEVTATGYTAGGNALANKTVAVVGTTGVFDADDASWTLTSSLTARGAVLYKSRGGASSADELIAYFDFGADRGVVGAGTFPVTWSASGILIFG